jgi:hypothetical protein
MLDAGKCRGATTREKIQVKICSGDARGRLAGVNDSSQAQPLVGKQYSQVAQVVTRGAGHNGITQGFE